MEACQLTAANSGLDAAAGGPALASGKCPAFEGIVSLLRSHSPIAGHFTKPQTLVDTTAQPKKLARGNKKGKERIN
jgi:hypothetical protein